MQCGTELFMIAQCVSNRLKLLQDVEVTLAGSAKRGYVVSLARRREFLRIRFYTSYTEVYDVVWEQPSFSRIIYPELANLCRFDYSDPQFPDNMLEHIVKDRCHIE